MATAKKKVYAIRKGKDPVTHQPVSGLLLYSWAEASLYVTKVSGVEYKGFSTVEEAEAYLKGSDGITKVADELLPDVLYCFVDGSFNKDEPVCNYGYGLCAVMDNQIVHLGRGRGQNPDAVEIWQVGGELLGAMKSVLLAKNEGHARVIIVHDYLGVSEHATGGWKRKDDHSKAYYAWMQKFFTDNPAIKVEFQKVDAHTGIDYNEIADGLARLAVALEPQPIFRRMVEKYQLEKQI